MPKLFATATLLALLAASAATAGPVKPKSGDDRERIVCKRMAETGSLVASHKVCKSRIDWDRERDDMQSRTATSQSCRLLGEGGGCP